MLPQDLFDTIAVLFMFTLRIGAPIALTLAFGYWLEKKLRPREEQRRPAELTAQPGRRIVRAGNIIQVHCWDLKRCDSTVRAECAAYKRPELPCWLALQADGQKVREECFTCALYKPQKMAA